MSSTEQVVEDSKKQPEGRKTSPRCKLLLAFLVLAAMLSGGFFLTHEYVASLLVNTYFDTLKELSEHDKNALQRSINSRYFQLENLADSLWRRRILSIQALHETLNNTASQFGMRQISVLGSDGLFYSSNGSSSEFLQNFKLTQENPNGFVRRVDYEDGRKISRGRILFGVPVHPFRVEDRLFRYIIAELRTEDIAKELSIDLYGGKGFSLLIDNEGTFIAKPASIAHRNFSDFLSSTSIESHSAEDIMRAVSNGETLSTIYRGSDGEYLMVSSGMENGWAMVSLCPKEVFDSMSKKIVALFFAIAGIFLFFSLFLFTMMYRERKMKNERELEKHHRVELEKHLDKIIFLNSELEERQTQLEESAAEQEAQLEEITALNDTLSVNQKKLETTINELEENNGIFVAAGYGLWKFVFDSEGKVCGLIGNNKWSEIFGVHNDRMTPQERFEYFSNGLEGKHESTVHNDYTEMRTGIVKSRVFAWNHPENGRIYVSVGGTRHVTAEGEVQISGYVADVTQETIRQQQQKNEILIAKKNAEEANAAKTSFLFNMSHDIRTPMNAIMGFRDLLEKHQDEPEKRADYLKKIEESSLILLSIINNVLEMARIEKGTIEIDETAWSAEQFNDTLYSIFQEMMRQKGIAFTRKVDVKNPYVFCDPIKLREIFINILSNAYKYTNPGGSVNMHLEEVPSDLEGYAMYRTTITDTGIGMSEEFLPHIFEEFSREFTTTDNKIEGTGLGMPIVKRLVDLLNGTIEVKSIKGEGTTFIVTIPHRIADKSNLVEHLGVEIDPNLFKGKRILLAEDNELNAEIAQEILGESGFIVDLAENGEICCRKLMDADDGFYDLILMDIQMPHMNGYEATRNIRRMAPPKGTIPILAMTANAFEEDKREALRVGMNGHLAKPINIPDLMKMLASVIG